MKSLPESFASIKTAIGISLKVANTKKRVLCQLWYLIDHRRNTKYNDLMINIYNANAIIKWYQQEEHVQSKQ